MVAALPTTYYRVLRLSSARPEDFTSNAAKYAHDIDGGRRRRIPDTGTSLHMWSGISVYSSLGEARRTARQYPNLGTFIGRVQVPTSHGKAIYLERTSDAIEHHTLWGTPDTLSACVDDVVEV